MIGYVTMYLIKKFDVEVFKVLLVKLDREVFDIGNKSS